MSTEEEEYYDSIDDAEFEECRSFCNDKFQEDDSEVDEDECNKINNLVPLYTGNVVKSEIESIKNDSKTSITTMRNTKLKRRAPLTSLTDYRKNRSYLTIFYSKNGQQGKSDGNVETCRATCTDLSPKRNLLFENDDRSSCYENANMESVYNRGLEANQLGPYAIGTHSTVGGHAYRCESETTVDSKMFSVSEAHFNSAVSSRQRAKRETKGRHNGKPLKMCELGGLGPNITFEKLELLRKRQDYGKTVSEKNRIKIMEKKVVQKLKQEIRESNKF